MTVSTIRRRRNPKKLPVVLKKVWRNRKYRSKAAWRSPSPGETPSPSSNRMNRLQATGIREIFCWYKRKRRNFRHKAKHWEVKEKKRYWKPYGEPKINGEIMEVPVACWRDLSFEGFWQVRGCHDRTCGVCQLTVRSFWLWLFFKKIKEIYTFTKSF